MTSDSSQIAALRPGIAVHLFQGPYVTCAGRRIEVPQGSRRLLAFVALRRTRVKRLYAAGTLWPFGDDNRAAGNLRSALWRLRRAGIDALVADKWSLGLADNVTVDVELIGDWVDRLTRGVPVAGDLSLDRVPPDALDLFAGWYDDWAIIERERVRQRVLHAMEAMSRHLSGQGRFVEAIDVAATVIAAEPLRETAHRVLLEAQLSQGDRAGAEASFASFRTLISRELGVGPSRALTGLMAAAAARSSRQRILPEATASIGALGHPGQDA